MNAMGIMTAPLMPSGGFLAPQYGGAAAAPNPFGPIAPIVQPSEMVVSKMYVVDCGSLSSRLHTYEFRGDGTIHQEKSSVKGPALHVGIGLVQDGKNIIWKLETQEWIDWLQDALAVQGDPSVPLRIIATAGIRSKAQGGEGAGDLGDLVDLVGKQVTDLFGSNAKFEVLSPEEEARLEFDAVRHLAPVANTGVRWGVVSCGGMSSQVTIAKERGRLTQFSLPMGCSGTRDQAEVKAVLDRYENEIAGVERWQAISSTCYAARSAKLAAKCVEEDKDPSLVPVDTLLAIARNVFKKRDANFPERHLAAMGVLESILSRASDRSEVEFRKTWDQDGRAPLGANVATGYFIKHGVEKGTTHHSLRLPWRPFGWFQKVLSFNNKP
jgi:hypothetical protein